MFSLLENLLRSQNVFKKGKLLIFEITFQSDDMLDFLIQQIEFFHHYIFIAFLLLLLSLFLLFSIIRNNGKNLPCRYRWLQTYS